MISKIKNAYLISSLVFVDLLAYGAIFLISSSLDRAFSFFVPELVTFHQSQADVNYWRWMIFVFLFFIAYEKLYTQRLPFWDETRKLVKAVSVAAIVILFVISLSDLFYNFGLSTLFFVWISSLFLFPVCRLLGKKILYKLGLWKENVIIIGAGKAGKAVALALITDTHLGFNLIGFLDDSADKIGTTLDIHGRQLKIFGKIRNFKKFVTFLEISSVIIAIPSLRPDKLAKLTNTVQKYTKQVLLIPDLKGMSLLNTELHHLFLQQIFLLKISNNLKSPFNRAVKRAFDIMLALLLLPVIAPMIGIIALLIKMDSKGPIFFNDKRVWKTGYFRMFKFRTMHVNADELLKKHLEANPEVAEDFDKFSKLRGLDPRVTRIGKFLRKTSMDELPQLFNVLKGDMSFVGHRPYLLREEKGLRESYYADTILLTNPGISGLWQVSGRNDLTFDDRLKFDTWYNLNWSLWFDIVILFKTVRVVLKGHGAY